MIPLVSPCAIPHHAPGQHWFHWICQRCGNGFKAQTRARDCATCASYGAHVAGRPFPVGEMGGE